jgi:Ca2+:H+ antiporter
MPRWLYALLLAVPIALLARALSWSPLAVFLLAAAGIIPLAGLIGLATEGLSHRVGPTIGGLLNATFGNAAELIIAIAALAGGLTEVVRASIAGSIIGNSLLVLGMAMLLGGWRHRLQTFNARDAGQYAALLALAVVGLVVPSVVALLGGGSRPGENVPSASQMHVLSSVVAGLLLVGYAAYLAHAIFNVRAKRPDDALATSPAGGDEEHRGMARRVAATRRGRRIPAWLNPETTVAGGVALLVLATVATAVISEVLVGAIEPVAHQVGLSPFFIGLIVLPVVGNAAEHSSAITMALRNRMDATMAITAGSAIQVALLVVPVLVFVGLLIGRPLDLTFVPLELAIFALVGILYPIISLDGESTWLEGLLLNLFYLIVAVGAFVIPR